MFEAEEQMMMLNEELALTKRSVEVAETSLEAEKKRTSGIRYIVLKFDIFYLDFLPSVPNYYLGGKIN